VLAELPTEYDLDDGWRAATTVWARDHWAFYLRHPWVLQVSQARPVLGPNEYDLLETMLRILFATGLPPKMLKRLVGTLTGFVRGAVQIVAESRHAPTATGVTDDEWWYTRSALLMEVAQDFHERFPLVTLLESEQAFQLDDETVPYLEQEAIETFEAGLAVILDGIEAQLS
jgi:hypothetical protein